MITYIKGTILKKGHNGKDSFVDVLTDLNIGYRVFTTGGDLSEIGEEIALYTSFQVREDSQTLFGFDDEKSRDFFEMLISVSGIGPKIGLAILTLYSENEIKRMILDGDYAGLSKTSGLGQKGAKKIILDLQSKLDAVSETDLVSSVAGQEKMTDVKDALSALGFKGDELSAMVDNAAEMLKEDDDMRVEDLVQKALSNN